MTPAELCAKYHAIHKGIYDWFRIDFDIFGHTPTAQHTEIVQDIFKRLWSNGFIEERETIQPYCPEHKYDWTSSMPRNLIVVVITDPWLSTDRFLPIDS